MVYSVVEFLKEKSVAVVPTSWFNVKKSKCAWPKKCKLVQRFLENLEPYNTNDFDLFEARVFKNDIGTYYILCIYHLYIKLILTFKNKNIIL